MLRLGKNHPFWPQTEDIRLGGNKGISPKAEALWPQKTNNDFEIAQDLKQGCFQISSLKMCLT